MKVSVITPTRDRSEAFTLLERWMGHQTRQPDQWVVVNDGVVPYEYEYDDYFPGVQEVINRVPKPEEGHSLCGNVKEGLAAVKGDLILFMEDDDWYHPDYIQYMARAFLKSPVVGASPAAYYNVAYRRARQLRNTGHASLAGTGVADSLAWLVKQVADRGRPFIDMGLWRYAREHQGLIFRNIHQDGRKLHVGIKGMPGIKGIGNGHQPYGNSDPKMEVLKNWIGEDYLAYKEYVRAS